MMINVHLIQMLMYYRNIDKVIKNETQITNKSTIIFDEENCILFIYLQ